MVQRTYSGFLLIEVMICFVVLAFSVRACLHIRMLVMQKMKDVQAVLQLCKYAEGATPFIAKKVKEHREFMSNDVCLRIHELPEVVFSEQTKTDNEIIMLKQKINKVDLTRKTFSCPSLEWVVALL